MFPIGRPPGLAFPRSGPQGLASWWAKLIESVVTCCHQQIILMFHISFHWNSSSLYFKMTFGIFCFKATIAIIISLLKLLTYILWLVWNFLIVVYFSSLLLRYVWFTGITWKLNVSWKINYLWDMPVSWGTLVEIWRFYFCISA